MSIRVHPWLSRFICVLIFAVVVVAHGAESGTGDYLIDVTTGEKGLPNSSVTAIAQTADGYLWVGTYNGLARFDGKRFVRFDPENTPALKNARIRRLTTSRDGTLWIAAHDGSLTSYRDGNFILEWGGDGFADSAVTLLSTRSNRPTFMLRTGEFIRPKRVGETNLWETIRPPGASTGQLAVEDGAGVIWCRGRDQKLWRFVDGMFESVTNNTGLQGATINQIVTDADGRIWVGTEREIAKWNGARFETMSPTNGEAVLNVSFIYVMSNGDVWSVANERVRRSRGREWAVEIEEARGLFLGWRDRTKMHEDAFGGAWLYDYGRGIFHFVNQDYKPFNAANWPLTDSGLIGPVTLTRVTAGGVSQ